MLLAKRRARKQQLSSLLQLKSLQPQPGQGDSLVHSKLGVLSTSVLPDHHTPEYVDLPTLPTGKLI